MPTPPGPPEDRPSVGRVAGLANSLLGVQSAGFIINWLPLFLFVILFGLSMVMVGVFSVFASLSLLEFKQLGVGLAAAVLIDATIVRAVLLPAAMAVLGERN